MNATTAAPPLWRLEGVGVAGRLEGVSLEVRPGVTLVRGASGAGKTTLLDVLCGHVAADRGVVRGAGRPDGGLVLWCGCGQGLWPRMTAARQITAVGGDPRSLQRFGLAGRSSEPPESLSLGERSRLELARGLAAAPETLVLDEPLTHVDPAAAAAGWEALAEFAAGGGNIVLATHAGADADRLAEAARLAQRVTLVDGRLDSAAGRPPATGAAS